jgi:hypothetical protein
MRKKGYHLLSNGKFIVSRDVIFDETERKSVAEIEILLERLDKQVDKEKIRCTINQVNNVGLKLIGLLQNMTILHQFYLLLHHKVHLNLHLHQ